MAYTRRMSRSYRKRPYKRNRRGKYSRRAGARSFQAKVKKAVMKVAETKIFDIGIENVELYHNCGEFITLFPGYVTAIVDWFDPWAKILKGTNRFNRIGDKITPRGMSIKLMLFSKQDRPNTKYRVMVCTLPKNTGGAITTARFDPLQLPNTGTCNNNILQHPDHDIGVRVLYDKTISMSNQQWTAGNAGWAHKEFTKTIKLWIRRKRSRDIVFSTSAQEIVNKPLAVYVIPYEQYSTLETDNIASCSGLLRMYYKDV